MATFFTADTHFFHGNIMKYCRRLRFMTDTERNLIDLADKGVIPQAEVNISQESIDRMNDFMIEEINRVVGVNDTLIHGGDVFWGEDKERDFPRAEAIRNRIKCRNIVLIWGNHDEPWIAPLFSEVHYKKLFNVDGQKIVVDHYPQRSWDRSHHGSWMLYGHVHGLFYQQDTEGMSDWRRTATIDLVSTRLKNEFLANDLDKDIYPGLYNEMAEKIVQDLIDRFEGIDLTLDIGVDTHDYRPWSMDELRAHFAPRLERWHERKKRQEARIPAASRKVRPA